MKKITKDSQLRSLILNKLDQYGSNFIINQVAELIDPKAKMLVFGGFIRDALLNTDAQDLDIKIVTQKRLYRHTIDRIESYLSSEKIKYSKSKIASHTTALRLEKNHLFSQVDLAITFANAFNFNSRIGSHISLNSLYFDLKKQSFFSLFNSIEDLNNRLIKLTNVSSFSQCPYLLFRCVFVASKLPGFEIDNQLLSKIKKESRRAPKALLPLSQSKDEVLKRSLLDQVFGGVKFNYQKYLELLTQTELRSHAEKWLDDHQIESIFGKTKPSLKSRISFINKIESAINLPSNKNE